MVKQVKTVEQAVEEVVQVQTQSLHVTLNLQSRQEAKAAMLARGMQIPELFDGPIFRDIAGYQVNGAWLAVSLKDGTTYAYPIANVSRFKHFNEKE